MRALSVQIARLGGFPETGTLKNFEAVWQRLRGAVESDLESFGYGIGISSPKAMDKVPRRPVVEGWVRDSAANVWVVAHPIETAYYWVQPEPTVSPDGRWKARIYVGAEGNQEIGKLFELRAFSGVTNSMKEGVILPDWPSAKLKSDVVVVERS